MNTDLLPVHTPTSEAALRAGYADSRRRLMNGLKRTPVATAQIKKPEPRAVKLSFDQNDHVVRYLRYKLFRAQVHPMRTSKEITMEVLRRYPDITFDDLRSASRKRKIVAARQEAMYRIFKERGDSYPMIGRFFGGRDHTTVMWAVKQVEKRMAG